MRLYPAALLKMRMPVALIGVALVACAYVDLLGRDARIILENLPYLLCLVAVLMAHQFNRNRLLMAAIGTAIFYWAVQRYLQASIVEAEADRDYLAISLALPVLTFFLLLIPE